ncbi:hypothetical protein KC19_6G066400 [Ceratodon purpureus]|uniref:Protein LOW PSII ACCUMULATION 1, chloroplastic n=1 Tax=Ceratodon purpureus TaxID=3225 RepID=A0A8T0HFQ8_CERPU|nr:hypothetical protein KC19_6G066400 [Ceratodon purpureus]
MQALLSASRAPALAPLEARHHELPRAGGCCCSVSFDGGRGRRRPRGVALGGARARPQRHVLVMASDSNVAASEPQTPTTPAEAVNLGLALFSKGRVKDALVQFDAALEMNPNEEEAQAALYNKACCHARSEEGEKASQALRRALKQYKLKFSIILNDPDMAPFRAMPEFRKLQDEARKGGEEVGGSFRRDLKLISEVQDPFRGVRKFFYVAFTAAAGISTLFTIPRFILAIQGGEGAPGLIETVQNLAINIGGGGAFVALYLWESKREEEQISRITRDETLSRLPVRLATNRTVELVALRENTRPVIIAGTAQSVEKSLRAAEKYREDLLKRGVLLIPLVWNENKATKPKKKLGFGSKAPLDEFEERVQAAAAKGVIQEEKRFKAEPVSPVEWESWVREQQESEGVKPGEDVYIVLRLDGRVRKSGRGMPEWVEIVNELAPLDTFISKLEK